MFTCAPAAAPLPPCARTASPTSRVHTPRTSKQRPAPPPPHARRALQALVLLNSRGARDSVPDGAGQFAVHHAAALGQSDCVLYLLKNLGSNVDAVDAEGRTPLALVVQGGQLDMVKLLVARGADAVHARSQAGARRPCRTPVTCTVAVPLHEHVETSAARPLGVRPLLNYAPETVSVTP